MELDSPKASPSESPRYSPKAADVLPSLPATQPPVRAISVASSDDMLVSPIESPQTRIIDLTVSRPVTPSNAPPPETSSLDLPHPEQGIIDMFALPPSPQKPHPSEPISAPPTFKRPPIKNPFVSGGFVTEFVGSMPELETPKVVAASIVPLEKPHTNGQVGDPLSCQLLLFPVLISYRHFQKAKSLHEHSPPPGHRQHRRMLLRLAPKFSYLLQRLQHEGQLLNRKRNPLHLPRVQVNPRGLTKDYHLPQRTPALLQRKLHLHLWVPCFNPRL